MSQNDRLEPGDVVRIQTLITDISGEPGDPGSLTFVLNAPDGSIVDYEWNTDNELVRESAGVFFVDYAITQAGTHRFSFEASGTNASYHEGSFITHERRVASSG